MTRTIVFVIAVMALVALVAGCGQKEEQAQVEETAKDVQVASAKVVDPVCGMSINAEAAVMAEHEGETYHFCSAHCNNMIFLTLQIRSLFSPNICCCICKFIRLKIIF